MYCSRPNRLKSSDKIDQYISKVEDFSDRARKLENDVMRYYCSVQLDFFNPFFIFSNGPSSKL